MSTKLMSQRDRTELRRILNARFQLLHEQIHQRQHELENQIRTQIESDFTEAVKLAKKKMDKLRAKGDKLEQEAQEIAEEVLQLGIVPTSGSYAVKPLNVTMAEEWKPKDLNKRVKEALAQITTAAGLHKLDLRLEQLRLEEELAIGALGSDEAKNFLERVPTLDKLLPMNGNIAKAIEAQAIDTTPVQEDDYVGE